MAYFINGLEVSKEAYEAWAAKNSSTDVKPAPNPSDGPAPTPPNDTQADSTIDEPAPQPGAVPFPLKDLFPEEPEPDDGSIDRSMAEAQKLGFERAQAEIDKLVEQDPFYALFTWDVSINTTLVYETINDFDDIAPEYRPGLAELEWEKYNSYAGVPTDYRDDLILREMEEGSSAVTDISADISKTAEQLKQEAYESFKSTYEDDQEMFEVLYRANDGNMDEVNNTYEEYVVSRETYYGQPIDDIEESKTGENYIKQSEAGQGDDKIILASKMDDIPYGKNS